MKDLSESLEMYLKTIYILSEERKDVGVHAKDIAVCLNVSRPSVTGALKLLKEKGFLHYEPYESVTVTAKGKRRAKELVKRYKILKTFFSEVLGVDEAKADSTACELEHAVEGDVLRRLVSFLDYMTLCPRGGVIWDSKRRKFFCETKKEEEGENCPSINIRSKT